MLLLVTLANIPTAPLYRLRASNLRPDVRRRTALLIAIAPAHDLLLLLLLLLLGVTASAHALLLGVTVTTC